MPSGTPSAAAGGSAPATGGPTTATTRTTETQTITLPNKGLVVREPWASRLVSGTKVWELRGRATTFRGRAAIIAAGTGSVVGEVNFEDCFLVAINNNNGALMPPPEDPTKFMCLAENQPKHGLTDFSLVTYKKVYAWVVASPLKYDNPIAYTHPQGAVQWIDLQASASSRARRKRPASALLQ